MTKVIGSIPLFDPDSDDDTDSVIDALQRDLEGDAIPADTFIDSLGSDFVGVQVGVEPNPIAVRVGLGPGPHVEGESVDIGSVGDVPAARDDPIVEHRGQAEVLENVTLTPTLRVAFRSLDKVDVQHIFRDRAVVIKSLPRLIRGAYKSAMRMALTEAVDRDAVGDGGVIPKGQLRERFSLLQWPLDRVAVGQSGII